MEPVDPDITTDMDRAPEAGVSFARITKMGYAATGPALPSARVPDPGPGFPTLGQRAAQQPGGVWGKPRPAAPSAWGSPTAAKPGGGGAGAWVKTPVDTAPAEGVGGAGDSAPAPAAGSGGKPKKSKPVLLFTTSHQRY